MPEIEATPELLSLLVPKSPDSKSPRRARALSLHRPNHYPEGLSPVTSPQHQKNEFGIQQDVAVQLDPAAILFNPHYNKGTAFTERERGLLNVEGLLPCAVESMETQLRRCYQQFQRFKEPMSKNIFLNLLRAINETLFYRLVMDHLAEMLHYICSPTVGQACLEYGLQFRQAEGMFISTNHVGSIRRVLDNWKPNIIDEVSIIVVTDGSRILGLGDLGASGMGIPISKLALYIGAGGFHPSTGLPVVLDVGTNNKTLLEDEFYLGLRHNRIPDDEYYALVDEFMVAVKDKWPYALINFEDISNNHCFALLEKYRDRQLCFNDDIQGTGAVIAAGLLNALRITKTSPGNTRILFVGAGSAGIGVADQIASALQHRHGLTQKECSSLFYMVDSQGLITTHRGDKLSGYKLPYARTDVHEKYTDLLEIVKFAKPTVLIGLCGQGGVFTAEVLKFMGQINEKPIVFSLSNPTVKAECSFRDAFDATEARVIFAAGSPFESIADANGRLHSSSQGNNLYTFPGLGFGAWLCKAEKVTDEMVTAAATALADCITDADLAAERLYPQLSEARPIAVAVATAVMECAIKQGIARMDYVPANTKDLIEYIQANSYRPEYLAWPQGNPDEASM